MKKKDIKANSNLVRSVYILILIFAIVSVTVTGQTHLRNSQCHQDITFNGCKTCDKDCKKEGGEVTFYDSGECEGTRLSVTGRHCMCHKKDNYCRPECLHKHYVRNCNYCSDDCKKQENGTLYDGGYCEGDWPWRKCMCHKMRKDCW